MEAPARKRSKEATSLRERRSKEATSLRRRRSKEAVPLHGRQKSRRRNAPEKGRSFFLCPEVTEGRARAPLRGLPYRLIGETARAYERALICSMEAPARKVVKGGTFPARKMAEGGSSPARKAESRRRNALGDRAFFFCAKKQQKDALAPLRGLPCRIIGETAAEHLPSLLFYPFHPKRAAVRSNASFVWDTPAARSKMPLSPGMRGRRG